MSHEISTTLDGHRTDAGRTRIVEEFFADGGGSGESYFGASRVVVLSASSETALGFADRVARRSGVDAVGVTSSDNREMVEAMAGPAPQLFFAPSVGLAVRIGDDR